MSRNTYVRLISMFVVKRSYCVLCFVSRAQTTTATYKCLPNVQNGANRVPFRSEISIYNNDVLAGLETASLCDACVPLCVCT